MVRRGIARYTIITNCFIVWQIAQRDYKFGKGKHSSLTKATYDAVANRFRSLWGKEAGWAHSVLFTADLKTFSDRLVAKVEVKEETVVKTAVNGIKQEEETVALEKINDKRVKRPLEEMEHQVLEVKQETVTRKKRAKVTRT
jgi:N-glycosylase/DNA lyase